jgi:hypothetical protein
VFLTSALDGDRVVSLTPRPLYSRGKSPVPSEQAPEPVETRWQTAKLSLPGIEPWPSNSLYRLSYPGHDLWEVIYVRNEI